MPELPIRPFLTVDFSPKGGGIDFLGLRWVNLTILAAHLIPGINNVTADAGTYCLGAWIPWKFKQLCQTAQNFTLSKFTAFRETIEVGISLTIRNESPSNGKYGTPRNRIGVEEEIALPAVLSFEKAKRTNQTSLYAAPLYGPSLRFLELIAGDAIAEDGTSTGIPLTDEGVDTVTIVQTLDNALRSSSHYKEIDKLSIGEMDIGSIDDLGLMGLNPSFFRFMPDPAKHAFRRKLLPEGNDGPGHARTKTALLFVATLAQGGLMSGEELRKVWYTGLFEDGRKFVLEDPELKSHMTVWAIFMSRQYQRFILELFLRCFELGLKSQLQSIEAIVDHFIGLWDSSSQDRPLNFNDLLRQEAKVLGHTVKGDFLSASQAWNKTVHGNHAAFDFIHYTDDDEECVRACRTLARWCLRMVSWMESVERKDLLSLGGVDRISMRWFFDWIWDRGPLPINELLKEIFSALIFGQHMRIALARFDGQIQRLRFVLGDTGIVPTASAASKLAAAQPPWMADRLNAFTGLLCDLSILVMDDQGMLGLGSAAEDFRL